jgi:hypothetical protein
MWRVQWLSDDRDVFLCKELLHNKWCVAETTVPATYRAACGPQTIMFDLFESVLPEFEHYLAIYTFQLSNSNFNLKIGANGSALCTSICLTSLTLFTFSSSSTSLNYCRNLQADHHSHPSLNYF